jgi:Reverse transcriptase (RNA-dependent DNA polymerase)
MIRLILFVLSILLIVVSITNLMKTMISSLIPNGMLLRLQPLLMILINHKQYKLYHLLILLPVVNSHHQFHHFHLQPTILHPSPSLLIRLYLHHRLQPSATTIPSNTTPVSNAAPTPSDLPPSSAPSVLPSKLPSPTPRRSQRLRHAPIRYGYDTSQGFGYSAELREKHQATTNTLLQYYVSNVANKLLHSSANLASSIQYEEGIFEYNDPFLFQHITGTQQANKDTFKYHAAIYEAEWEDFVLAAKTFEEMDTWAVVLCSSVPMNKKVLGGNWVFRHKLGTDGKVLKHKARYCVRGDQQTAGVDYFDSYAPVCMWSTVRFVLILSVIADLAAVQVDYTIAFAQANLSEEVYIEFPKGFSSTHKNCDFVLKLKKSLYGLVQAPCTFYEYLTINLKKSGFSCTDSIYSFLWINHKTILICVIYVDDCLLFTKEITTIYKFIEDLQKTMPLTVESTDSTFLGINMTRQNENYF